MKIGLCTPYKVDNYGTKLQAYAVQEKIRSMGYEVEVVNFDRRSDLRVSRLLRRYLNADYIKGKIKVKKDPRLENDNVRINLKIRKDAINCFDKSHYSLSPLIKGYDALRKYGEECSAVVCGSDQIWLPGSINNPTTTLEFASDGCRRIAFAPSFGISEIPEKLKERYRVFLRRFDFLSAREIKGAEIIHELIGKDVPVVLDPTLSVEKKLWDRLADEGRTSIREPYMFCYFLGQTERHRIESRRIADKLGLKLVTLPHFKHYVPADEDLSDYQLYNVTPCDFVRFIKEAKFVCTDSFHATVFSILYQKKFMTFERFELQDKRSANSRIYSLLGQLELVDHIWSEDTGIDTETEKPDFDFVNKKLAILRQETDSYLKNAFDGIEKAEK